MQLLEISRGNAKILRGSRPSVSGRRVMVRCNIGASSRFAPHAIVVCFSPSLACRRGRIAPELRSFCGGGFSFCTSSGHPLRCGQCRWLSPANAHPSQPLVGCGCSRRLHFILMVAVSVASRGHWRGLSSARPMQRRDISRGSVIRCSVASRRKPCDRYAVVQHAANSGWWLCCFALLHDAAA